MKKFLGLSIFIFLLVSTVNVGYTAAQEKPAAEESAAPAAAVSEEKAAPEVPAEKAVKKTTKKAAKAKAAAPAKKVQKGETLSSLVKAFKSVHKDVVFAEKFVNPKAEEYDKSVAKALANDLLKWKKARINVKKLKNAKSPQLEEKENSLKELEESILAKYTEGASASKSAEDAAVTDDENGPKTEKGKELLEKLRKKRQASGEEAKSEDASKTEEKPAEEKKESEKPAVKVPSNIRIEPRRALYNNIEPSGEATTKITLKNRAKGVFEGTLVPIENWITVNPTTVTIEPGSQIDVEVTIKAQETSKSRVEGTLELRCEGESSKRIPAVVRTK